jgi:hypothetical protein
MHCRPSNANQTVVNQQRAVEAAAEKSKIG